ncbi:MmgE/PrpD family protein [Rhodococcus sp. IEGM 1401]|uniref:MmgE/PrpD family protein n=1 Tax=unclassified Rhodococcus (in: high G+C Gram-positive bacteria) TaxID=192944 RepID=UPI0022B5D994|nr:MULTISPECIES: MmgE/PrpD family protein [unclassified Rhodococcus (in: high G+C Gram-positive bacteria)]MCZ4561329.1 MmgE/PrpD family protein [Rhodococcus sp. IEGM 1401]MDI9921543.1 MmgE/PrpD family protein [Rhodococcus sp. IEGM 1372]MDV8033925.1 MmgE/PrpD family protein [Rhodococcus sp. IEGM 1414]
MDGSTSFRSTEQMHAVDALATAMVELRKSPLSAPLGDRTRLILLDLLGVTLAGARTAEMVELRKKWDAEPGSTYPIGGSTGTTIETAAELDAIASCCLELDEGNKYAAGHPAAHVLPAAIAAARLASTPISGRAFLTAVVAGYEVAARFGWALTRHSAWHTHGHWGATGAATAAALIRGADANEVAAAIDSSSALIQVAPWAVVLDGNFSRNLWIGGAARAGVTAARLARSGVVHNSGAIEHTLGALVGTLDTSRLTEDLGDRWLTLEGYTKQHASCSYTHAAVDAVQSLRADAEWSAADIEHVRVRTHSLAEPLFRRHPSNRLGAMFSLPFVVAAAFVSDAIDVDSLDPRGSGFSTAESFSARVDVASSSELDALLPERRAAEVTIEFRDGTTLSATAPNPLGDIDHFPMDYGAVRAKIARLVGESDTAVIEDIVDSLGDTEDVAALLRALPIR